MWTDEQRGILTLSVRGEVLKVDPLPMVRRYRAGVKRVGNDAFSEGLRQLLGGEETPGIADIIMPVLRDTMGWKPFDQGGYTEQEVLIGFTQFLEWLVDSKKKDGSLPSSAGSAGDSAEIPATTNTPVSVSAGELSNPEGLGSLPQVPTSPEPTPGPA